MTRSIALLGSTGSIGRQTLEVARELFDFYAPTIRGVQA